MSFDYMIPMPRKPVRYPRSITTMHQIEMTSICNLRCSYCTWPTMPRPKVHMSRETFLKALDWVSHFRQKGTQGELNLAGIGESTIHPDFVGFLALARKALGWNHRIVLATNGLAMTDELANAIRPYNPRIWVSLHRPEKAGPAIEILKRHNLIEGVSTDPAQASIDWAGQVDYHVSAKTGRCDWLAEGWVMAMADGRVTTCCLDATGAGVVGTVESDPEEIRIQPYSLCDGCHLTPPEDGSKVVSHARASSGL